LCGKSRASTEFLSHFLSLAGGPEVAGALAERDAPDFPAAAGAWVAFGAVVGEERARHGPKGTLQAMAFRNTTAGMLKGFSETGGA